MWAKLAKKEEVKTPPRKLYVDNALEHKSKKAAVSESEVAQPAKRYAHADGRIRVVVLDSGAFISRTNFFEYFNPDVLYYTTDRIVKEVRDPQSRQFMQNFPFPIKVRTPSANSVKAVINFCKKTRDLSALSIQDKEIIALAYELEIFHHGTVHLNSEPPQKLGWTDASSQTLASKPLPATIPLAHTKKVLPFDLRDFLTLTPEQYERKHDCTIPNIQTAAEKLETTHSSTTSSRSKGISGKTLDRSFATGEWVTPENFTKRQRGFVEDITDEEQMVMSSVGCITTDYHMQNAMIQMGVRLLSLNGKSIRHIRYWIKRCFACFVFCNDTTAKFCPKCGNMTLQRAFVKVTEDGRRIYKFSKREITKRGRVYAYPKRKGGRNNRDLILAEDEYREAVRKAPKVKKLNKISGLQRTTLDFDEKGRIKVLPVVGYGRRNPNVVRKTGKRRRKKRR